MKQALITFREGDKVKIECVHCGKNFRKRLIDLGLFDGAEIEIIKNDKYGPLILKIFNSQIALGRGQAAKIYGNKI
ncbi:ferrous iron transport protein A [Patescibacteria group bacterium]|nr:ferrous iron transport protein A [Patescibacteria group bacterium]MBU0964403.1 ferrous iron transport protein A [Patescibacteria group bacterium]